MKYWKIMVIVVIVLLVVALGLLANYALTPDDVRTQRAADKATIHRIKRFRVIAEEQKLIRQILEDKMFVAKIQAQLQPKEPAKPKIEMQQIPMPKFDPNSLK